MFGNLEKVQNLFKVPDFSFDEIPNFVREKVWFKIIPQKTISFQAKNIFQTSEVSETSEVFFNLAKTKLLCYHVYNFRFER